MACQRVSFFNFKDNSCVSNCIFLMHLIIDLFQCNSYTTPKLVLLYAFVHFCHTYKWFTLHTLKVLESLFIHVHCWDFVVLRGKTVNVPVFIHCCRCCLDKECQFEHSTISAPVRLCTDSVLINTSEDGDRLRLTNISLHGCKRMIKCQVTILERVATGTYTFCYSRGVRLNVKQFSIYYFTLTLVNISSITLMKIVPC